MQKEKERYYYSLPGVSMPLLFVKYKPTPLHNVGYTTCALLRQLHMFKIKAHTRRSILCVHSRIIQLCEGTPTSCATREGVSLKGRSCSVKSSQRWRTRLTAQSKVRKVVSLYRNNVIRKSPVESLGKIFDRDCAVFHKCSYYVYPKRSDGDLHHGN